MKRKKAGMNIIRLLFYMFFRLTGAIISVVLMGGVPWAQARDIHVPAEYKIIQAAIDAASTGDVVVVGMGTYYENIDFSGKAITVQSTKPDDPDVVAATIIDGGGKGSIVTFESGKASGSVLSGFTVNSGEESNSVLSGFTVRNGSAEYGGGIYCGSSSSPGINNCIIIGNSAEIDGGGIYCMENSSPGITNCTISGNRGAGIFCKNSSATITNCTISGNRGEYNGFGIYCRYSSQVITNCTISGNWGGGIFYDLSSATITNCTISGNRGGGIEICDSSPRITNCILWNDSSYEIYVGTERYDKLRENPVVTYCDVKGGYTGFGNIDADPLFVGSENGNYYLRADSPCIDKGTSYGAPAQDQTKTLRPQGLGIDMGAYEYVESASCTPRASFTIDHTTGVDSLTVHFDASSSGGSQYPDALFSWDFGDSSTGSGLQVSHTYTHYGAYDVSLTIKTACGTHTLTLHEMIKIKSSTVTRQVGEGYAYTSIQRAIDDAEYGEIIQVHDGTYGENITFKGKAIILCSEHGAADTIIDGGGVSVRKSVVSFHDLESADSILDGFTIQNGYTNYGGGISCLCSSPSVTNCIISRNTVTGSYSNGGGISCRNSSPSITNCVISSNSAGAGDSGGGIYCSDSSPSIINCTISSNSAGRGGGIDCSDSSSPSITNCILWNDFPDEIYAEESSTPVVTYCDIQGGYTGVGNIDADPLFVGSEDGNYYLRAGSPCIDRGILDRGILPGAPLQDQAGIFRPKGMGIDMGACEYVESASCIPRASFTVDHTKGVNSLTVHFDASSSGSSQYPGVLFLWDFGDGSTGSGITASHIYSLCGSYNVSLTITTECGTFTITLHDLIKIGSSLATGEMGREAGISGYAYTSIQKAIDDAVDGEVILVHDGTYVENLDFKGKRITVRSEHGAASTIIDGNAKGSVVIFDRREDADSVLDGFTIRNGSAEYGSGIYCRSSSPVIANCIISGNPAGWSGGGICCSGCSPSITNCTISGNSAMWGGGIHCESSSSPAITNCTISGNSTVRDGGGINCNGSSPSITNCTICDNSSGNSFEDYGEGGGIYCRDSSPSITNCTISGNSARNGGGGIDCSGSSPSITNCILWNDSPNEIGAWNSTPMITYCDIQGGYAGVGNINANPLFVGSEDGNYYLRAGSPCIDKGKSSGAPSQDQAGTFRPQRMGIDMGAYEYVEPASCTPSASFTLDHTSGIDPLSVHFDASSSGASQYPGTLFTWEFGDGSKGNGLQVSHTYTRCGIYDVSLTVTTECGSRKLTLHEVIKIKSSTATKEVGDGRAYTSIQKAIDDAGYGEIILVHDGTYHEHITFKGKVVTVRSEHGAAATIIDGGKKESVVTFDHNEGADSLLDGFTIQNGVAAYGGGIYCRSSSPSITNCIISSNSAGGGGGIYCGSSSSPSITNCTISGNSSNSTGYGGGGIYCDASSSPRITNCTISGNSAGGGGGIRCYDSSPTITNCTISSNSAEGGGGGISCEGDSSPRITNCSISSNSAIGGGGIDCSDSSPSITNCIISGNSSNSTGQGGGGISCAGDSSPLITNCTISGNSAGGGGGICCAWYTSPNITNCTISGNSAEWGGGGIYCYYSSPTITNCTISGNGAGWGGGIRCYDSSPTITNCIIWNDSPDEIHVREGSTPVVTYCDIQGGYADVGNIDANPLFVGGGEGNYYLRAGSPCIDKGTSSGAPSQDGAGIFHPQGLGIDMGAYEYVESGSCTPRASFTVDHTSGIDSLSVHFDASSSGGSQYPGALFTWEFGDGSKGSGLQVSHTYTHCSAYDVRLTITTECGSRKLTLHEVIKIKSSTATKEVGDGRAYTSIQKAIDDAEYGEIILVHDGTYVENISFKGKAITVRSEHGAAATIIDGGKKESVVTFDHNEGVDSLLDGFTIQNGSAAYGGGIYCYGFSSPSITNCIISGNSAGRGSGIYCYGFSSPSITNCTISGNSAKYGGGGIDCDDSSPVITNCTISGNSAGWGGGIYCIGSSSASITNCTISKNSAEYGGGGIYCDGSSSPSITNCTISGNSAESGGGGIYCDGSSSPSITNCTISKNSAEYGGGIYCSGSSPVITNCTISGNSAGWGGGGIYCYDSSPTITNCILWNNSPSKIYMYDCAPIITYSNIQGGYAGEGNIDADPSFVDPNAGDYHLQSTSPCIDAGSNEKAPPSDQDGRSRTRDGDGDGTAISDMGAYEYWGNHPPRLTPIGNKSIAAGDILRFTIAAEDPDSDTLTYSASNLPSSARFDPNSRKFSWKPHIDQIGNYEVTFTVLDNAEPEHPASASETVTITVRNINHPPEFAPVGDRSVKEGDLLQFAIHATDPDGDSLSDIAIDLPPGASFDPNTQELSWRPDLTQAGTYAVIYAISDNGTPSLGDIEAILITVENVNRAPILDQIPAQEVKEGESVHFTITATDPAGDTLTYVIGNLPDGAGFDPNSREFSWKPRTGQAGNYEVIFTVIDQGTAPLRVSQAVRITVHPGPQSSTMQPMQPWQLWQLWSSPWYQQQQYLWNPMSDQQQMLWNWQKTWPDWWSQSLVLWSQPIFQLNQPMFQWDQPLIMFQNIQNIW